jgi:hypothetical protein
MVMINCFVLGEGVLTQTFVVDIKPEKKVSHLRVLIYDRKESAFGKTEIDDNDLVLYEVAISTNGEDEKYNIKTNLI